MGALASLGSKIAAELYPFRFLAVQQKPKKEGGGWSVEVFE